MVHQIVRMPIALNGFTRLPHGDRYNCYDAAELFKSDRADSERVCVSDSRLNCGAPPVAREQARLISRMILLHQWTVRTLVLTLYVARRWIKS